MPKARVEHLDATDWKVYRDIRLQGLSEEPQAFLRSGAEELAFPQEKWIERVNNPYTLVAFIEDEPVGTVGAFVTEGATGDVATIVGMFVAKQHRGSGIGKALLGAVLEKLHQNKTIVAVQLSVNSQQLAAVNLYGSLGFMIVGEKEAVMGDGNLHIELVMRLDF